MYKKRSLGLTENLTKVSIRRYNLPFRLKALSFIFGLMSSKGLKTFDYNIFQYILGKILREIPQVGERTLLWGSICQTEAELVSALKMHSLQKSPKNESTLLKTYILFVQRWKKQFPCLCASVLNCFLRDNTDLYFISGQLFTRCGLGANQNTKRKPLLHRIIPRTSKLKFFQKWWKLDNLTYAMSS